MGSSNLTDSSFKYLLEQKIQYEKMSKIFPLQSIFRDAVEVCILVTCLFLILTIWFGELLRPPAKDLARGTVTVLFLWGTG